jgi:hypothetical protein
MINQAEEIRQRPDPILAGAANRRMTKTMIGFRSGVAVAPRAGRPSPSCRCSLPYFCGAYGFGLFHFCYGHF